MFASNSLAMPAAVSRRDILHFSSKCSTLELTGEVEGELGPRGGGEVETGAGEGGAGTSKAAGCPL